MEPLSNGKKLQGGGNGEEYLLRRLKRQDAKHETEFAAKWAAKLAKIAEDGRKKMSSAKAGNKNAAKEKTTADHSDQRLKPDGGRAVAREARAAEAHVSSSTMGCWDWRLTESQRKRLAVNVGEPLIALPVCVFSVPCAFFAAFATLSKPGRFSRMKSGFWWVLVSVER